MAICFIGYYFQFTFTFISNTHENNFTLIAMKILWND
jgi:hypothetical protein